MPPYAGVHVQVVERWAGGRRLLTLNPDRGGVGPDGHLWRIDHRGLSPRLSRVTLDGMGGDAGHLVDGVRPVLPEVPFSGQVAVADLVFAAGIRAAAISRHRYVWGADPSCYWLVICPRWDESDVLRAMLSASVGDTGWAEAYVQETAAWLRGDPAPFPQWRGEQRHFLDEFLARVAP